MVAQKKGRAVLLSPEPRERVTTPRFRAMVHRPVNLSLGWRDANGFATDKSVSGSTYTPSSIKTRSNHWSFSTAIFSFFLRGAQQNLAQSSQK